MAQENQFLKAKLNLLQSLKNNLTNINPVLQKKSNKETYPNILKLKSILTLPYCFLLKGIPDILQDPSIKVLKLLLIRLKLNSIKQISKNKGQKASKNQDLNLILILT